MPLLGQERNGLQHLQQHHQQPARNGEEAMPAGAKVEEMLGAQVPKVTLVAGVRVLRGVSGAQRFELA